MKKYRAVSVDHHGYGELWKLQKRVFFFFWKDVMQPVEAVTMVDSMPGHIEQVEKVNKHVDFYERMISQEPEYDFVEYIEGVKGIRWK